MPMRMGEMMVVVRAQDFASRTLRRVGSELSHMSREQMIAARRSDIAFQRMIATQRRAAAVADLIPLRVVGERNRLQRQSAGIAEQLAGAQRRLNAAQAAQPRMAGRFGVMTPAQRTALAAAKAEFSSLTRIQAANKRGLDALNTTVEELPPRYRRAGTSVLEFGRAWGQANRNLALATNNLNQAQRAQLAFDQAMRQLPIVRLHETARAISGIGRTLQLFGAVSTVAFGYAASSAASFETRVSLAATQMTRVNAGLEEAQANANRLSDEILDLAKDFPFAASEMADAVYEIFSGTNVQRIDQGMALLEAFARVAVGGQVGIQDATKAGIIVLNNFAGAGENVGSTLNRMFAIVRFGFMRFEDFTQMIPKVAAAAAGSGQSLDDMGGAMAFLTRRTGSATIAATQISRAFDVMTRKEFQEGMENLGVSITDVEGRLLPLPQVLDRIVKAFPELRQGGKSLERFIQIVTRAADPKTKGLIATTEARRFFRFIFRGYDDYVNLQRKVITDNKEFARSFQLNMQSSGVQWEIFTNRVKIAVITIGQQAIPVFASIGEWIARALDWWNRLSESTRGLIVRWSVMLSVGTLIAGVLASLVGAFITLGASVYSAGLRIFGLVASLLGFKKILDPTVARTARLATLLMFLGSIGAIVIGIKLEKMGDSVAWEFIGKGLQAGGIAGIISKITRGKVPALKALPGAAVLGELLFPDTTAAEESYASYIEKLDTLNKSLEKTFGKKMAASIERGAKQIFRLPAPDMETKIKRVAKFLKDAGVNIDVLNKKTKTNAESWQDWMKRLTKAFKKGDFEVMQKEVAKMLKNTLADQDAALDAAASDQADRQRQMAETARQAQLQAVDSLRQMYIQMEDVNRQAFGQLFQGPWLTSETFDLAKEWGIEPRAADIIKDLAMQTERFTKRGELLAVLAKRGLPREFLAELKQMTPEEVMPILFALVDATPKQTTKLIGLLKNREKLIKQATKVDFTNEIEAFRKAGVSMADALQQGFQSAKIGAWFDGWVQAKFPQIIVAAVAKAVAEWKRANPPPEKNGKPTTARTTAAITGATTRNASYTTDSSRTINIDMRDVSGGRTPEDEARIRKKAFAAANMFKGTI